MVKYYSDNMDKQVHTTDKPWIYYGETMAIQWYTMGLLRKYEEILRINYPEKQYYGHTTDKKYLS